MKKQSSFQIVKRSFAYLVPTIWSYKKGYFFFQFISIIIDAVIPFVNIIFPKLIIDELLGGRSISRLILFTAGIFLGNGILGLIHDLLYQKRCKYKDNFERFYVRLLADKTLEMDFEYTEDPAALEQLEKASEGISRYSNGIDGLIQPLTEMITNLIMLGGVVFLLSHGAPYMILLLAISVVLNAWFTNRVNKKNLEVYKQLANNNRAFEYTLWELSDIRYGKDIRLYHAQDMMESKSKKYLKDQIQKWHSNARDIGKDNLVIELIGGIRDVITFFYLGFLTISKVITIGDFSMFLISGKTFGDSLSGIVGNVQNIFNNSHYINEFVTFMKYPTAKPVGTKILPVAETGMRTIRFENVSFCYPRTDNFVLKNINLTIRAGEHLSIVGLNGSGKTTFIKLLCRLYDPTEGTIYMDEQDISTLDYDTYVKELAVVFQDFYVFAFTIKENIILGDGESVDDIRVNEILGLTGMKQYVDSLPKGMNTFINKQFDKEGTELSGGQLQKLAIARALYKDSPVVILDEPTAALDPVAEYEIYQQFNTLIGGKTAIYISHRLSSCKFCDVIAVFSENSIVEYGTHDELVAIPNGIYSEMFQAQAQYYC